MTKRQMSNWPGLLVVMLILVLFPVEINAINPADVIPPAPRGSEPPKKLTVAEEIEAGMELANRGAWSGARRSFYRAFLKTPAKEQWNLDPGLLFNLALSNDQTGGRQLAAILWYRAFLEQAPESDLVPQIRRRVTELESEFDAQLLKRVILMENIFREVQLDHSETSKVHDLMGTAKSREVMKDDQREFEYSVRNIEAARIFLGDLEGALKKIRSFGIENQPSDVLSISLAAVKAFSRAGKYADSKEHFQEVTTMVESNRVRTPETCTPDSKRENYISLAYAVEEKHKDSFTVHYNFNYKYDLVELQNRKDILAWRYMHYTPQLYYFGLYRWKYNLVDEMCE